MTTSVRGQPPGRAGRTWLERRLGVATRGGDLLERKLRILLSEQHRFVLLTERTGQEWAASVRDLDLWMLRAGLVGGQRGRRLASPRAHATADLEWQVTMGVKYPARATCRIPDLDPADPVPDSVALLQARSAARRAVQAGVEHAAAVAALAAVGAEIDITRRQARAVRRRWIPALESARTALATSLEDQEHDEAVRLRWASDAVRARPVRR